MSNLKLLSKMLRLKEMKITHFEFKNHDEELRLTVKPYKNGCRSPERGQRGRIVCQTRFFRCGEDLTLMGMKLLFGMRQKRLTARRTDEYPLSASLLVAHYLSSGMAHLHPVPDHDPEGRLKMPPSTLALDHCAGA